MNHNDRFTSDELQTMHESEAERLEGRPGVLTRPVLAEIVAYMTKELGEPESNPDFWNRVAEAVHNRLSVTESDEVYSYGFPYPGVGPRWTAMNLRRNVSTSFSVDYRDGKFVLSLHRDDRNDALNGLQGAEMALGPEQFLHMVDTLNEIAFKHRC